MLSKSSTGSDLKVSDRVIGASELINRMAEDLRVKSGSDLPLSCFVDQVKMRLAGRQPTEMAKTPMDRITKRAAGQNYHTADLFKAWAMPESL